MNFEVANIVFSIVGEHPLSTIVLKELHHYPRTQKSPNVIFNFLSDKELPVHDRGFIHVDNLVYSANTLYIKHGPIHYSIMDKVWNQDPLLVDIKCYYEQPNKVIKKVKIYVNRLRHWNYLTDIEILSKDFMYGIFDYLIHLKLLQTGGAFLHSSGVVKNSKAVLFPGWGGVGKTSLLIQLIEKKGWKFLSDDLVPVSKTGIAFLNPKYLQIYPYNIKDDTWLYKKLMGNRSILDKINWAYKAKRYGNKAVRRRVSPVRLFGNEKIGSKGKVTKAVHLVRKDIDEFKIHELAKDKLALYCTNVIFNETKPMLDYILATKSSSLENPLPDLKAIFSKCEEVYAAIFREVDCFTLYIPHKAKPKEVLQFLIVTNIV